MIKNYETFISEYYNNDGMQPNVSGLKQCIVNFKNGSDENAVGYWSMEGDADGDWNVLYKGSVVIKCEGSNILVCTRDFNLDNVRSIVCDEFPQYTNGIVTKYEVMGIKWAEQTDDMFEQLPTDISVDVFTFDENDEDSANGFINDFLKQEYGVECNDYSLEIISSNYGSSEEEGVIKFNIVD